MLRTLLIKLSNLQRFVDRPWYLPLLTLLVALDLFLAFIPSDALLIASVLVRPKRWWKFFIALTTGSACGALALAVLSRVIGPRLLDVLQMTETLKSPTWVKVQGWLHEYGGPALGFVALGPLPQQPAVALCGLSSLSFFTIFMWVWLGRGLKYGLYAYIAAYSKSTLDSLRRFLPSVPK